MVLSFAVRVFNLFRMAVKMSEIKEYLMLENSKIDEVRRRLSDLDPNTHYEVTIRRTRSKPEIAENLQSLSDQTSFKAKKRGLTPQKLREIISVDEEELQNIIG